MNNGGTYYLKLGMREIARLRPHITKESIVASPDVRGVVKEAGRQVDEIVPKKQLDFEKMLVEDIAKLGDKERLETGSFYLKGKKITPEQEKAILEAHNIGKDYDSLLTEIGNGSNSSRVLNSEVVPLKGKENVVSKINAEYGGKHPEMVRDILRGSIVYDDLIDLRRGLQMFKDSDKVSVIHINNSLMVINANPTQVSDYQGGNEKIFGFLVGQYMKASAGSGNPKIFNEILKKKLG